MKEKLYTIPLMDAFKAEDECPFCFVERQLEQHAMDFVLGAGASYMEDDVRAETDKMGFCRTHYKKMYDYGNRLGTGLILKTHFQYKTKELHEQIRIFAPSRAPFNSPTSPDRHSASKGMGNHLRNFLLSENPCQVVVPSSMTRANSSLRRSVRP